MSWEVSDYDAVSLNKFYSEFKDLWTVLDSSKIKQRYKLIICTYNHQFVIVDKNNRTLFSHDDRIKLHFVINQHTKHIEDCLLTIYDEIIEDSDEKDVRLFINGNNDFESVDFDNNERYICGLIAFAQNYDYVVSC